MYVSPNFKTKKALKKAVANGDTVRIWEPIRLVAPAPENGTVTVEGPHFPKPHRWYGQVTVKDGKVVSVK
jgi:hypothetical protein